MTPEPSPEQEQLDAELDRVLADYLEKLDQGQSYPPEQLLADHPELSDALREFLTTSERVESMAGPSLTEYLRKQLAEPKQKPDQSDVETASNAVTETQVHPGKPTLGPEGLSGMFGRYEIVRRLGAGGMGEVYLARDTQLDRMVALKTPRLDAATDETLDRFMREARTAAKIHHPNICSVFDVGQIDRIYYVTMAFIEGEELGDRIKKSRLSIEEAVALARKIAVAVGEAHSHGVIHRDLKPANVMIDHRGEPVVMDFGLAREVKQAAGDQLTRAGSILGSPAYMAPEQLQTKGKVGPGMDVYALGVILYEMLAGRRPFSGSFEELAGQVLFADPQPPRELRKEVPPALEQVVLKMLAKEPDERYQTMDEVIAALDTASTSSSGSRASVGRYVAIGGGLLGVLATLLTVIVTIEWEDGTKTKLDVPKDATVNIDTKNKQVTVRTGSDKQEPTPSEPKGQKTVGKLESWLEEVSKLPLKKRLDAVTEKLQELNPGFDGKVEYKIRDQTDVEMFFNTFDVSDISPIRAIKELRMLECQGSSERKGKLVDLSPLRGLKLTTLRISYNPVVDLSPLAGMELTNFRCHNTSVVDLSPLSGMPLVSINCRYSQVSDLAPLKGMPLKVLVCSGTRVSDLSPLRDTMLEVLHLQQTKVEDLSPLSELPLDHLTLDYSKVRDLSAVAKMPLRHLVCSHTPVSDIAPLMEVSLKIVVLDTKRIQNLELLRSHSTLEKINNQPASEFWKEWNNQAATFEEWIKQVSGFPAKQQIEAVAKKLQELNPGFDGKVDFQIRAPNNIKLTIYTFDVKDISPIRAIKGLQELDCVGTGSQEGTLVDISPLRDTGITKLYLRYNRITDLSPLKDLKLESLSVERNPVQDLEPLRNMPLTYLNCGFSNVADLSPLEGMPLEFLNCQATQVSDLSPLSEMPLKELYCGSTQVSSLAPLRETNLTNLLAGNTQIRDLTPLRGMPLIELGVHYSPVSDLSPLKGMQLEQLRIWHTEVKNVELLTDMPLKKLWITPEKLADISPVRTLKNLEHINGQPPAEFWKEWNQQ